MAKTNFKKEYRDLEMKVLCALKEKVENSKYISKTHSSNVKAIPVNVFDYTELIIVNDDRLTFLDGNGYHYSLFADCTLEDLIDILNK